MDRCGDHSSPLPTLVQPVSAFRVNTVTLAGHGPSCECQRFPGASLVHPSERYDLIAISGATPEFLSMHAKAWQHPTYLETSHAFLIGALPCARLGASFVLESPGLGDRLVYPVTIQKLSHS